MSSKTCRVCGGSGRTRTSLYNCPECGKKFVTEEEKENKSANLSLIPLKYRNFEWNDKEILKQLKKITGLNNPETYINSLSVIYESFSNPDKIPYQSFFISSPLGLYLNEYMYRLMMIISDTHGYSLMKPENLYDLELTEELINKKFLFIKISDYKIKESLEKLNYLLDKRETFDCCTFIFTKLPYAYLNNQNTHKICIENILQL